MKEKIIACLEENLQQNLQQKLTTKEIAQYIIENYPEACKAKQERSFNSYHKTEQGLLDQIIREISSKIPRFNNRSLDKGNNFRIKTTNEQPVRYCLEVNEENDKNSKFENNEAVNPENNATTDNHNEVLDKQNIWQAIRLKILAHPTQNFNNINIDPDKSDAENETSRARQAEQKLAEQKQTEQKQTGKRQTEQKQTEQKQTEQKQTGKRQSTDKINYQNSNNNSQINIANNSYTEHDLYPKLTEYLKTLGIHSKRIDDKRSSNNAKGKGANEWLHPDVVVLENLSATWHIE